jgi:hypothetical protein
VPASFGVCLLASRSTITPCLSIGLCVVPTRRLRGALTRTSTLQQPHIAAAHNNPPLIGLLIQAGADRDARTPEGKTALDIAKSNLNEAAAQQIELLARQDQRRGALAETPPTEGSEAAPGQ